MGCTLQLAPPQLLQHPVIMQNGLLHAAGRQVALACHGAALAFACGLDGDLRELYAAAGAAQHLRLSG